MFKNVEYMHDKVHSELSIKKRNRDCNKPKRKKRYQKVYIRKIRKKKSSKSFSNWPFIYKLKKLVKKYKKNKKMVFIFLAMKCSISVLVFVLEIIL